MPTALLPAAVLVLILAGCASSDTSNGGQPTARAAPKAALDDGRHFGFIRSVGGEGSVSFDVARFLTGDEAAAAAEAAGQEPLDFFIDDPDEGTVELPLSDEASITIVDWLNCCETTAGVRADFVASFQPSANRQIYRGPDSPYWIEVSGGTIVAIEEQYLP